MTLAQNRLIALLWQKLRTKVGVRFTRFAGVAILALATSETTLAVCDGLLHMTSTPAAVISIFAGAVVSYVLSRWAWERKGRPDVLRETVPFYVISAMAWVILYLATKLGYHIAAWMHLSGFKHVLVVGFVYLIANFVTFLLRFMIFHYVLFAERTTAIRAAVTGPDAVPPGTRHDPKPAEAPHPAASAAPAEVAVVPLPVTETAARRGGALDGPARMSSASGGGARSAANGGSARPPAGGDPAKAPTTAKRPAKPSPTSAD